MYNKEMKVYTEGMTAMRKLSVHKSVMKDLNKIIDDETRALMMNTAKQKQKLLLSRDYLALIKFKQLCVAEEDRIPPPNKIAERRTTWKEKYENMPDPLTPRKPLNYCNLKRITVPIVDSSEFVRREEVQISRVQIDHDDLADDIVDNEEVMFTCI